MPDSIRFLFRYVRVLRLGIRRWSAFVSLFAFQIVPVGVGQSKSGKLDTAVGFNCPSNDESTPSFPRSLAESTPILRPCR